MITLDGVALPIDLVWKDKLKWQSVAMTSLNTLGGNLVVFTQQLLNGRPITLEATESTGWIEKSVVDELVSRSNVPGALYVLTIGADTFNVMFRHTEPPALDLEPLVEGYEPSIYYKGVLKFITI